MEFKNIVSEHDCDCLDKVEEDNNSHFAIKTMKENIRIQDFLSYWEKGKRPDEDHNNCEKVCSLKGVSISIFNDHTKDDVVGIISNSAEI